MIAAAWNGFSGLMGSAERAKWAALVAALVLALLTVLLVRPASGPDRVVVRVTNGPTVISTQVVPLNRP